MTEMKRDLWLADLASIKPLQDVANLKIPLELKSDALLDMCLEKEFPIERAIWLIKCVGHHDMVILK